ISSAWQTLIISLSERNHDHGTNDPGPNDSGTIPFHRRIAVLPIRFYRFRHHAAERRARADPLRSLLLRNVRGRSLRGGMGDVVTETLIPENLTFPNESIENAFDIESQVAIEIYGVRIGLSDGKRQR